MEKVGLGVPRLPPGFRFHPTDEELVVQYLRRKALCCPLPAAVIPEVELSRFDPWDLPGSPEMERYFFSHRETRGSRRRRASTAGYWKATGKERQVVAAGGNQVVVVGMKRTLVFYRGKAPRGSRTDWVMHEYRLAGAGVGVFHQGKNSNHGSMEDWVLCRIFKRTQAARSSMGRRRRSSPSPSDSSESSCITEASSDGCCSEEESSSCSSGCR